VAVIEAEKKPSALYTGFKQKWLGWWSRFAEWRLKQPYGNYVGSTARGSEYVDYRSTPLCVFPALWKISHSSTGEIQVISVFNRWTNLDARFRGHDKLSHCLAARDFNQI